MHLIIKLQFIWCIISSSVSSKEFLEIDRDLLAADEDIKKMVLVEAMTRESIFIMNTVAYLTD